MHEILTLVKRVDGADVSTRNVFCRVGSIGMREFYAAYSTDYHPEVKFILPDYLEYQNETLADFNGQRYRILRTYRTGQELELTAERAAAEDGGADG